MAGSDIYRDFGQNVADLRKSAGLTQAELARKIEISRASLANIERGEQRVYLHQLLAIMRVLEPKDISNLLPSSRSLGTKTKADVTVSGDKLSKSQERTIKELVNSITATSRRVNR